MPIDPQTSKVLGALTRRLQSMEQREQQLIAAIQELQSRPKSVQEEIDAYEGRRIESVLAAELVFTINDQGQRAAAMVFQVNQDGPFVMTHYPMALWRPTAPTNATNFGKWRPVTSFPLPTQQIATDFIDILYELADGGSQRNFQNQARGPLLSRPDNIVPCPIPTVFPSNSAIQFTPTFNRIDFVGSTVPATQGTLHVDLIGYRIVNL